MTVSHLSSDLVNIKMLTLGILENFCCIDVYRFDLLISIYFSEMDGRFTAQYERKIWII